LGGSIYQLGARRRGLKLRSDGPALSDLSVAQALERGPPAAALLDDARLPRLYEDDDLEEALRMLTAAGATTALVLADDAPGPEGPLGIVTRQGILDTWQRMAAVRSAKAGSAGDA
jgi:hypothetical protein